MPLLTANNKRIFFAHVSKTGGLSVEDNLINRFGYALPAFDECANDALASLRSLIGKLLARGVVYKQHRHWLR